MQNERVTYWLEMCDYDLETAKAMLVAKRYLYVGFMCHLTAEKALKAFLYSLSEEHPPYTHSLNRLLELSGLTDMSESHLKLMQELEPLSIEARYTSYKNAMEARLTPKICENLLTNTETFLSWIKTKL